MSTRWYPLYQKGNPQLRIYLPNFWMKLVPNSEKQPKNMVQFHCSMEMTRYDVKNYLEKIYKVPVICVRTRIELGKFKEGIMGKGLRKEDDVKIAHVIMPKECTFEFPNITEEKEEHEEDKPKANVTRRADIYQEAFKKYKRSSQIPGVVSWFKI